MILKPVQTFGRVVQLILWPSGYAPWIDIYRNFVPQIVIDIAKNSIANQRQFVSSFVSNFVC